MTPQTATSPLRGDWDPTFRLCHNCASSLAYRTPPSRRTIVREACDASTSLQQSGHQSAECPRTRDPASCGVTKGGTGRLSINLQFYRVSSVRPHPHICPPPRSVLALCRAPDIYPSFMIMSDRLSDVSTRCDYLCSHPAVETPPIATLPTQPPSLIFHPHNFDQRKPPIAFPEESCFEREGVAILGGGWEW